jgi:hypothetical protein
MTMFKIFTVGWDPAFTRYLLSPVAERTGISFVHGLVGDTRRLPEIRASYPEAEWVALSKAADEALPEPDFELLASIEGPGVATIRSMVRGDRVLRHREPAEALAYATLLTRRLMRALDTAHPDAVLASYDNIHSALALGVAKRLGIPWVAMAFTVIPDNLTWFCRGLAPDTLLPLAQPVDDRIRSIAREVLTSYRSRSVRVVAYRAPTSLGETALQLAGHIRNASKRAVSRRSLGVDRFTFSTLQERAADIARRYVNRLRLPASRMVRTPPDRPYVFFPLHMAPESSVDTWAPMYQNQLELASQLALAVPADTELVVKLHFSDPDNYTARGLGQLMHIPGVRVAHPEASSRAFIERAALVFGIQGTANMEAALLGRPILVVGDSPYQHLPGAERAVRIDMMADQIRRMLQQPRPTDDEIVAGLAQYIARYRPGRVNDWTRPIEEAEMDRYADCFAALRTYVEAPGVRTGWYAQPPFDSPSEDRSPASAATLSTVA